MDVAEEIIRHYESEVDEDARLRDGAGRLELARTAEIVRRWLPAGRLRVLDVGGATGAHAEWLLDDGHAVHLVDPVAAQVERAVAALGGRPRFSAEVGDARALSAGDGSFDAVLLLGPLYHLTERADRVLAWAEAGRVLRPGGLVFGAAISRFASLLDGLDTGAIFDPAFRALVVADLATGQHRNPDEVPGWFTTAYLHRPEELPGEVAEAGLEPVELVGVEGPAAWVADAATRWDDAADVILETARAVEAEPSLLGASPHVIAVARRAHPNGAEGPVAPRGVSS